MSQVRAKFKVIMIARTPDGQGEQHTITMQPVYSQDPESENAQFWKYTPSGEIKLNCVNPLANAQFELGKEYYVDFTKAD